MTVIAEIADIFAGTDKPISVEVNPHLDDWQRDGHRGQEACRHVAELRHQAPRQPMPGSRLSTNSLTTDIKSNLTLVFSAAQALQAMRMGAAFRVAVRWLERKQR